MILDSNSGAIHLNSNLVLKPEMTLAQIPKGIGIFQFGFLSIPLDWNFSNMPWWAGVHESKSFFRSKIKKVALGPDPYRENTTIDEANREEERAFAQQEFLKQELGSPLECRGEAAHYLTHPVYVYVEYKYKWGIVTCGWDPKNMLSTPIEIEYF